MLLNVSYNNPKIKRQLDKEVGAAFTLAERIRLKGIGSTKLIITEASIHIHNLLVLDNNRNVCNIELRPGGILLGFRSLLDSYVLVIPFHKLSIYKGKAEEYTIYRDDYYLKIAATDRPTHKFIHKILEYKLNNTPPQVEDL